MSRRVNIFRAFAAAPSCSDADVDAFFAISDLSEASLSSWLSAIGKTYTEVKAYTCEFITTIKAAGITGTNGAMYLPIGNTADQRKWNFWNPVDSDAAFRLTYSGGISFTNFAIVGNGVNGFTNTHWTPSANGTNAAMAFAIDSADNITGVYQIMGVIQGLERMFVTLGSGTITIATFAQTSFTGSRKGLFISRRDAVNFNQSYRDGVSLGTLSSAYVPQTIPFFLNACNTNGSAALYSPHGCNFAFLRGQAWTNSQALALDAAYATFKTQLGIP